MSHVNMILFTTSVVSEKIQHSPCRWPCSAETCNRAEWNSSSEI